MWAIRDGEKWGRGRKTANRRQLVGTTRVVPKRDWHELICGRRGPAARGVFCGHKKKPNKKLLSVQTHPG